MLEPQAGQRSSTAVPRPSAPRPSSSVAPHARASARMSAIPRRPPRAAAASSTGGPSPSSCDPQADGRRGGRDGHPGRGTPAHAG